MEIHAKYADKVTTGYEQVLLDDHIHPFVANIKLSESQLKFFTIKETKYTKPVLTDRKTIPLSKIVSVQHIPNTHTHKKYHHVDIKTLLFNLDDAHFTRIFLRSNKPVRNAPDNTVNSSGGSGALSDSDTLTHLDIATSGFSRLHVHISSLWHAQRVRAALCIDSVHGHTSTNPSLAEEYYFETLASLKEAASQQSSSLALADQVEILHEFSDEVVSDIELKTICFKSKELFIMLFAMHESVCAAPEQKMTHMRQREVVMTEMSSEKKESVEVEETMFKRLLLLHAVIRAMHAILTSSQSIASRFDVFSWQHPLDLQSWVRVCVQDTQAELCTTLGHKLGTLNETEVNLELNKSFENVSICTPKRKKSSDYGREGQGSGAFFSTNLITNVFSEELLTPLRERVQKQNALFGVDHRSKMAVLIRSIKDLQTMLAFVSVDACVTGRQAYRKHGDIVYPPPTLRIVESIVRQEGWEEFVEDVMIRISNSLDDMLVLDSVASVIKTRFLPTHRIRTSSAPAPPAGGRDSFNDFNVRPAAPATPLPTTPRHFPFSESDIGPPPTHRAVSRLRMSPSPRHRKKITHANTKKKTSFRDMSCAYADSGGDSDINTLFETQEVLLHDACCLIRMLVLDHAKVRSFLVHDIDNHWFGIMHSMNLLFPRPEPPSPDNSSGDQNNKKDTQHSEHASVGNKRSVSLVDRFFRSRRTNEGTVSTSPSTTQPPPASQAALSESGTSDKSQEETPELSSDVVTRLKEPKKQKPVLLQEYGPPLYTHLNSASWEAMEQSIELLGLDVEFYYEKSEEKEEEDEVPSAATAASKDRKHQDTTEPPSKGTHDGDVDYRPHGIPENGRSSRRRGDYRGERANDGNDQLLVQSETQDGHSYEVTVPLLNLPTRVSDSFEKGVLGRDGPGDERDKGRYNVGDSRQNRLDSSGTSGNRRSLIADRFKRK